MEAKTTLMGWLIADPNLLNVIHYDFLTDEENNLLREYFYMKFCECPTLHNNPVMLKNNLRITSISLAKNVRDLYKAYVAEYSPIENYRRVEETERITNEKESGTVAMKEGSKTDSTTTSNTESASSGKVEQNEESSGYSSSDSTGVDMNLVSAYDTSVMSLHDKKESTSKQDNETSANNETVNRDESETTSSSESDITTASNRDSKEENNRNTDGVEKTVSTIYGNIGVTTSQQMVLSSVDLFNKFDFFDLVTNLIFEKSNSFYYYWV